MARGKRNKRGKRHVRRQTPQSLREFWEAIGAAPDKLALTINGVEIDNLDALLQAHALDPRRADREIQEVSREFTKVADRRIKTLEREGLAAEMEVRDKRERIEVLERISHDLKIGNLTDEEKERVAGLPDETIQVVEALVRLQMRREKRGADPGVREQEVAALTGMDEAEVNRLLRLAHEAGLVNAQGTRLDIGARPRQQQREAPKIGIKLPTANDDFNLKGAGLVSLPTPTLRHFARIAQDEGLPLAPPDEDLEALAALARHMVVSSEVRQMESGRHFVRCNILTVARGELADRPETGRYAKAPLAQAIMDLTQENLPPALEDIRREWAKNGWIRKTEDGWEWELDAKEIQHRIDIWEAHDLGSPQEMEWDLPLRQFGLLVEAGRTRVPATNGESMPIHAGARSFEAIWRRQTRYLEVLRDTEDAIEDIARRGTGGSGAPDENVGQELQRQSLLWRSKHVAAGGILAHMRQAKTVSVDLDVSEGLPDWESPQEAWTYASEAELPFPVTYFDFTTPGGYRPKVALRGSGGGEHLLTLRAALCWTMEDHLAIAPFAWLEDGNPADPDKLGHTSDYDSIGALHFGRELDLLSREGEPVPGEELDFITHLRVTSERGIAVPAQVVRTAPLMDGLPGWVDLMSDQARYGNEDAEGVLLAEATMTVATACRVLSVIHALDGTVNIELAEGTPSRPERRRAERAAKKGQRAEISKTVRIHPTRQTESIPNGKPGKREYSHAHYRRGHFAHYPIGTRMADRLAERDHTKLVDHPVKGLCRKIYRKPTIVGRVGPDGQEREPVAKSYVWQKDPKPQN